MNLPNWLTFELTIGWATLFKLITLLALWNLGFYAITRKGKLLHFILAFFTRKNHIETPLEEGGNRAVEDDIRSVLLVNVQSRVLPVQIVSQFLKQNKSGVYSKKNATDVLARMKEPDKYKEDPNQFYISKAVNKLPDWIIDPIVVCITCMASFHGLILFITYCLYKDIAWNPILQLAISVPVAFLGEFLWYLKLLIEKHK